MQTEEDEDDDEEEEGSGNISADEDSVNVSLDDGSEADAATDGADAAVAGDDNASGSTPTPPVLAVTESSNGADSEGDDIPEDIQRSPKTNSKWQSAK